MKLKTLLKWPWYRSYYAASFLTSVLIWAARGAKTYPELGPLGRTRWRCIGCFWRYSMAHGDYRIGLARSIGKALIARAGRTMYGEALVGQRPYEIVVGPDWRVVKQDQEILRENHD